MRKLCLLLALFTGVFAACAQSFDLPADKTIGDLTRVEWRFHTGDDADGKLGRADPDFDDASWPLLRADRGWAEQGHAGYNGYAWYRLHVHLPQAQMALALSPIHVDNAYRLYWNGQMLGGVGELGPHAALVHRPYDYYRLTTHGRDAVIAVRVWSFAWGAPYGVGGAVLLAATGHVHAGSFDRVHMSRPKCKLYAGIRPRSEQLILTHATDMDHCGGLAVAA